MPKSRKQKEQDGEQNQDEKKSDSVESDWEWKGNELEVTWAEIRKKKKQRRQEAAKTAEKNSKDPSVPPSSNSDVQYRPRMFRSWSENDISIYRELLYKSYGLAPVYSSNRIQPQTQAKSNDPFQMGGMTAALPTQPSVKEANSQSLERPAQQPPKSRRSNTRHCNDARPRSSKGSSATGRHRHQEKDKDRARRERPREDRTSEKKRRHA